MKPPSPLSAAEAWNLVADGYAAELSALMLSFSRRALELSQLEPSANVLDVAAGPGTLALAAAARVASVTAVDFSAAMLQQLRVRAVAREVHNLSVIHGDGQALPLPDQQFDAAFSMFGWMFFPDRPKGLAELRRVLKPGASLLVSSWSPQDRSPLMAAMFGALRAADPSMPPLVYDPESLENPERLACELREGGFEHVVVHEHTAALEFESSAELWARMERSSAPVQQLRKRVGDAAWQEHAAIATAYLARELGPQRSLATTAWQGFARRPSRRNTGT